MIRMPLPCATDSLARMRRRRGARQLDDEGRARPRKALHRDPSPESIHDLTHDPEPESQTAVVAVGDRPLEPLEDARLVLGGNSDPMVADEEPRGRNVASDIHLDGMARPVLDGIGEQIHDDLFHAQAVPLAHARADGGQLEPALRMRELFPVARGNITNERRQVYRLAVEVEAPGRDPRDVEKAVDQGGEPVDLPFRGCQAGHGFLQLREIAGGLDFAGHALYLELERRQRRLQLVRGDREKLVTGADRLARVLEQVRPFPFRAYAIRNIPDEAGEDRRAAIRDP